MAILTKLLDREEMLRQIRAGDLGDIRGAKAYLARAEATMLSDDGPSDELERLLVGFLAAEPRPSTFAPRAGPAKRDVTFMLRLRR